MRWRVPDTLAGLWGGDDEGQTRIAPNRRGQTVGQALDAAPTSFHPAATVAVVTTLGVPYGRRENDKVVAALDVDVDAVDRPAAVGRNIAVNSGPRGLWNGEVVNPAERVTPVEESLPRSGGSRLRLAHQEKCGGALHLLVAFA